MECLVLGNIGPSGVRNADGAAVELRVSITGDVIGSALNPRYADQSARGNTFTVSNTGSTALSMGTTNATGLILTNPPSSGKNFALLEVNIVQASVPGAAAPLLVAYANGSTFPNPNATVPLVVKPTAIGLPAASAAVAASGCWIPNSTPVRAIGGGPVAGSSVNGVTIHDEVAGALVLTPGTSLLLQSFTTQIGVIASYTWSEIPV